MFALQILANFLLFLLSILGILFTRQSILVILMCIEIMLLSLNLNYIIFSIYLEDMVGQIFSLFILTIAASESAIGLAILILCYRIRGNIELDSISLLRN